jgi:hypothetical protein
MGFFEQIGGKKMNKEKLNWILGALLLALVGLKFLDNTLIWQLGRIDFQKASGLSADQIEYIGFADRETAEARVKDDSKDIKVVSYYNFFEPTSYVFVNNKEARPVVIPWLGEVSIGNGQTNIGLSKLGKASLVNGAENRKIDSLLIGSWFSLDFDWIKHLMFLSGPGNQKKLTYNGIGVSKYIFVLYFHIPLLALFLLYQFVSRKFAYGALYFILFPLLFTPFSFWYAGVACGAQIVRDLGFQQSQSGIPTHLSMGLLLIGSVAVVKIHYYIATYTWKTFNDYKEEKILQHEWALLAFFWVLPLVWAI